MKFLLLFVQLVWFSVLATSSEWHYPDLDQDSQEGHFPKWGGICDSGSRQSPINLNTKGALKGVFQEFHFSNYDKHQDGVTLVNNGHSIQLSGFPHEMELKGGALIEDYVVEQIHLHWWSEHTINDKRYPLEAHIVHRNEIYPNMSMAADFKDGITVVGVLFHVSNRPNDAITSVIKSIKDIKNYSMLNKPIKMKDSFIVRDLFPDIQGYFTYEGSLTTPSCAEAVTWIVLTETFPVTLEQVQEFKEIEYEQGRQLHNNYRELQSIHNRAVVLVIPEQRGSGVDSIKLNLSLGVSTLLMLILFKFLQ